ncbi:MAG: 1,4-alpha-glucan branching protein GlgB [Anaerolineales bacterium]|nr:1,4-alpha-glucan branching protein GlgB [Anaerolineales bacterium]
MATLDETTIAAITGGYHSAPFDVLGLHTAPEGSGLVIRTFQPEAKEVALRDGERVITLERLNPDGFFEALVPGRTEFFVYQLAITDWNGQTSVVEDPYRFPPVLDETDLYLFNEGNLLRAYEKLGAHLTTHSGVAGTTFTVWAPGALRVSVVGDFNRWDGRRHPMRPRGASGLWELFIPAIGPGTVYKYEVKSRHLGYLANKADPYGFASEVRPANASVVYDLRQYTWQDADWVAARAQRQNLETPMAIYEAHLGSWKRTADGQWLSYRELADTLIPYLKDLGYTHIETMPIAEHPYDGSWGYQVTGYYAPTARFGSPDDFRYFVDRAHQAGLGVIVDWVPAHFPKDEHGLGYFDGTHLYEHADPRQGEHKDWGTFIFNFGRNEVRNFLLSNALFWLEQYHIDGLRVDAVASMLYLDYSRKSGEWVPNRFGGRENLEAVDFLKRFNELVHQEFPGALTYAEESTAWPLVSRPVYLGGLGFDLKWNMGWMHDILEYMEKEPVFRRYHHHSLTFSMVYAFTENFVLSFSHDEVVYGKRSMLNKMPGDDWQRFANLRALYAYMYAHPGKKLVMMGCEFGQWNEWNFQTGLDWHLLDAAQPGHERHVQMLNFVRDLNRLYQAQPALYEVDFHWEGFQWVDFHDVDHSIVSFIRYAKDRRAPIVVIANFTPVPREGYRVGLPVGGFYREILNSDSAHYGGSNLGNAGGLPSEPTSWQGQPHSAVITVPPLGVVYLQPETPAPPAAA